MPKVPHEKEHRVITYLTPIPGESYQQMVTRVLLERWLGPIIYFLTPGVPLREVDRSVQCHSCKKYRRRGDQPRLWVGSNWTCKHGKTYVCTECRGKGVEVMECPVCGNGMAYT